MGQKNNPKNWLFLYSPGFHHHFTGFSPGFLRAFSDLIKHHHFFTGHSPTDHDPTYCQKIAHRVNLQMFSECSPLFHQMFTTFSPGIHQPYLGPWLNIGSK